MVTGLNVWLIFPKIVYAVTFCSWNYLIRKMFRKQFLTISAYSCVISEWGAGEIEALAAPYYTMGSGLMASLGDTTGKASGGPQEKTGDCPSRVHICRFNQSQSLRVHGSWPSAWIERCLGGCGWWAQRGLGCLGEISLESTWQNQGKECTFYSGAGGWLLRVGGGQLQCVHLFALKAPA